MGHKEYNVLEIVDILRRWLEGDGMKTIARSTGMDRNTVRKYIRIAEEKGFSLDFAGDLDEIAYLIFSEVHPERKDKHGVENKRDRIFSEGCFFLAPCIDNISRNIIYYSDNI